MKLQTNALLTTLILFLSVTALKSQNENSEIKHIQNPASVIKIISIDDIENILPDCVYEPKVTFQNTSHQAQLFDVTMEISGGYKCVKRLTLLPAASVTAIFNPVVLKEGAYIFNVEVNGETIGDEFYNALSDSVVITNSENISIKSKLK